MTQTPQEPLMRPWPSLPRRNKRSPLVLQWETAHQPLVTHSSEANLNPNHPVPASISNVGLVEKLVTASPMIGTHDQNTVRHGLPHAPNVLSRATTPPSAASALLVASGAIEIRLPGFAPTTLGIKQTPEINRMMLFKPRTMKPTHSMTSFVQRSLLTPVPTTCVSLLTTTCLRINGSCDPQNPIQ